MRSSKTLSEEQNGTSYVLGGFALVGTGGTPRLSGAGTACAGSSVKLVLTGARPDSNATLYIGTARVDRPFRGGTLVPAPQIVRSGLRTDAMGRLVVPNVAIPPDAAPASQLHAQIWIVDPAAPQGMAASNAMSVDVP